MANKNRIHAGRSRGTTTRSGRPHTIYFTDQQTYALDSLASERRVTKTQLVKFAVDLMLDRMRHGQLELPLGV